ncbi:MAG: hypothetical protein H6Q33_442 [Deltaproteobacteria bacterium]|nr:hypothetical protein [Deltaproteobacteria bacterium]
MFSRDARTLSVHAAVIILMGMITGFPYGSQIVGAAAPDAVRAWRTAHMLGLLNGLFLIAVAALWDTIVLSQRLRNALWWCLVLGGYANTIAPVLAAVSGYRGLEPAGPGMNWLIFGIYQVSALLFPAGVLLLIGLAKGVREP